MSDEIRRIQLEALMKECEGYLYELNLYTKFSEFKSGKIKLTLEEMRDMLSHFESKELYTQCDFLKEEIQKQSK